MRITRLLFVAAALAGGWHAAGRADQPAAADWHQWGGPTRDFVVPAGDVDWTRAAPRVVWQRPLGEGYSGIAAVGDSLYTMYREDGDELVVAVDAATGETRWTHRYPAPMLDGMNPEQGPGPHATPLVIGGRVFAAGATGRLHALSAETGAVLWERRLIEDLGGTVVSRGYSSSPLAFDDRVLVQTGGDGDAITAFDAATGRIAWRGGSFENVNASPILADVDGEMQVIALGAAEVVGLEARTGETRWTHPHPHRFGENIPTPVWSDGQLFVTSYADGGSRVLAVDREAGRTRVRELWHHRRLRVYYTNAVRIDDVLYASSGDLGPTVFTAAGAATGDVLWQSREIARSNMVAVGRTLILRDDAGRLVVATPGAGGPVVHSATELLGAGPPTPPALRGARLYLRDRRIIMALRP